MSVQRERSEFFRLIEQQISKGKQLRLYYIKIPANDTQPFKYKGCIELITEAEEWSKDTIERLGLYNPFYRAKDWNKSNAHILGEYKMPDKKLQHYQDLLKCSVESLESFRDKLKSLIEASELPEEDVL